MEIVDLKDQMLQPYLLEQMKGSKWYMKLHKTLLNVAVHNSIIIRVYQSMPKNKGTDPLKFRPLLIQGLVQKHMSAGPRSVHAHPSTKLYP
jgi:hypothetical protein